MDHRERVLCNQRGPNFSRSDVVFQSKICNLQRSSIGKAFSRRFAWLSAALSAFLFFSALAFGQNDVGSIVGFIMDSTGAVVPSATVTIVNEGTGEKRVVTSDPQGRYTVPNLPPATYSMTAEAAGFQKFESIHNTLASNSTISIDAKLAIGQATQTVEVSATAELLQTESGSVQSEITGQQIQNQELNGRNPLYETQLLPGAASTATLGDFNFAFNSGDTFSINGARTQDTEYTIDGAPAVRTRDDGEIIAGVNVDSTQEIQVLTADYSAEYGGASGAQVRIVTKSGTKDFHGTAYEYLRNAAMDANTWSRNLSPSTRFASPFTYNNFGFAFGGPVWAPKVPFLDGLRNKFFFFINEDYIRYRFDNTETEAVPTTLMRTGNFSELLGANPWYPAGTKIYDPATCPSVGAASCVPYPNNVIPTTSLSPNGLAILDATPAPTPGFSQGTDNYEGVGANPENQRKGQINGDWLITPNQHLSYRRSDDSYYELDTLNASTLLVPIVYNRPNQANGLGWTWTISPTMINEAHFSVSIDDVYIVAAPGAGYDRGAFGINFPYIIPGEKAAENKIPTATLPVFLGIQGGPYPSHSSGIIYAGSDSVTKVLGNHSIKGGIFFDYLGENDNDQINVATVPGGSSNQNGTFTFTDTRTGLGATSGVGEANLALGLADNYTEIGPKAFTVWRGKMFEEFIQDDWQATPKMHFNYGIRVSTIVPPSAQWANADYFDPALYDPAAAPTVNPITGNVTVGSGNQYDGVVIPGFSSFPHDGTVNNRVPAAEPGSTACNGASCASLFAPSLPRSFDQTRTILQPRVGLAYQALPKTVIRAGAGEFTTNKGIIDNVFPGGNSPFQPTVTVSNVSVDNPGASLNTTIAAPITITTLSHGLKPPIRFNWNMGVEQLLPGKSVLSLSYVGARGLHNWDALDINQAPTGALIANAGDNINYLRPYKGFAEIQQEQSGVSSDYDALQASWNWHTSTGSSVGVAYTYSKSMDDSSNYRDILPDTYNHSNLWAASEFDIRHILIVNYLYALPFFRGQTTLTAKLLGGWKFSGVDQFQSGTPCGVGSSNDYAGVGEVGSFGCGTEGQFWVQHGTPSRVHGFAGPSGTGPKWFSTTSATGSPLFTAPPAGTFNLQDGIRDDIYGPGLQNHNIALIKAFPIYREATFEFRAEAYNFVNHPNLSNPDWTATDALFGTVTSKSSSNPRTLQVGARINF